MILQEALLSAGNPVLNKVMHDIPANLLNKGSEQFTTESRNALRKTFEEYVNEADKVMYDIKKKVHAKD